MTFPDEEALASYRADENLARVAHLREAAVVKTEILVGEDGPDYARAGGTRTLIAEMVGECQDGGTCDDTDNEYIAKDAKI